MRVVYVGNFGPAHSTETHVAQALEAIDVEVVREQEDRTDWSTLAKRCTDADFVLWTSTHDYSPRSVYPAQRQFLADCPVPTVGYHLDIWWDLPRAHRVAEAPFFKVNLLVTADGGHDDRWPEAGVNHRYLPPAVSEFECGGGTFRQELASPVAFVGSWQGGYHPEHQHRDQLVRWLQKNRPDCVFYPRPRQPAVRGEALRDLYSSVNVVVGDSCFAGRIRNYHSDRIPETLGRGGFLLHPVVEGVTDGTLYTPWEHLCTWRVGDWDALGYLIDWFVERPDHAREIAEKGRAHVLAHHTYTVRMRQLLELLKAEGLL